MIISIGFLQSGLSDPLIKLKIPNGGQPNKRTKYLPKTLNPVWNEIFVFPDITDPSGKKNSY